MERNYEELAHLFCAAIKKLASNENAINNMESYLSYHFDSWMKKWAYDPDGITYELERFARMYD